MKKIKVTLDKIDNIYRKRELSWPFNYKYELDPTLYEQEYIPKDIATILKMFEGRGYELSEEDAYRLWCMHSEDWSACWLICEGNDNDWKCLLDFWEEV